MNYNVLESMWFGQTGIVKVQTEYDGVKFYIGTGFGRDQKEDEQYIAAWGKPVYPNAMQHFLQVDTKNVNESVDDNVDL